MMRVPPDLGAYIPAVGVLLKAARESTKAVDVVKPTIFLC